jgi:hypothetical protein
MTQGLPLNRELLTSSRISSVSFIKKSPWNLVKRDYMGNQPWLPATAPAMVSKLNVSMTI